MPDKEEEKIPDAEKLKKEEKDKHNALLAGVVFFMLLIIILWVMNLNIVFKAPVKYSANQENIDKLTQDFQNAINQAGTKMSELKSINPADLQEYEAQLSTTSSSSAGAIKN